MQLSTKKGHTKSVQERQGASESLECLKVVTTNREKTLQGLLLFLSMERHEYNYGRYP
jgi:hypothetical protein